MNMDNGYINPLFWLHGEEEDVLRNEVRLLKKNGINEFIIEARPHPHYLKEKWWSDLEILLDEAKKQNMGVWFFDDGDYPSGCAQGRIREFYPQYLRKFIREAHIDAAGPLNGSSFLVKHWLCDDESLFRVIAAKKTDGVDAFDSNTLTDITDRIHDGILYWDVPDGLWRVFMIIKTPHGAEEHIKDHINPIEKDAVKAFIDIIYEEHYKHFKDDFGKTIKGFFTDEPRIGNAPTYDGRLGTSPMVLPYSDELFEKLGTVEEFDFMKYLPCLWYDGGDITADVRYVYIDMVNRLFSENYMEQIGIWCTEHNVKLIGHLIEENGAHARLGYGVGHFFRATNGMHMSGIDVVYNLMPGYTEGSFQTYFLKCDTTFNHWGLAKMASSASHIDPKKQGKTICEAFGAYGWQEGLKMMKWITDHLCVRGVNVIVPHAFSPKEFPDDDCPPHFYARGNNPQWKYFNVWSDYTNRVCDLLTHGVHKAPVAVVYHAEAEWGGKCEPFEYASKKLMQHQIDCDIVPMESINTVKNGRLVVNNENYRVVVVPYFEYMPAEFGKKLLSLKENGVKVIIMTDYPKRMYFHKKIDLSGIEISNYDELPSKIAEYRDIRLSAETPELRYYHYENKGKDIYFFVNESRDNWIKTNVHIANTKDAVYYDAMENKKFIAKQTVNNQFSDIELELAPYESIFVIFDGKAEICKMNYSEFENGICIGGDWKISISDSDSYPGYELTEFCDLGNLSVPDKLPYFSGTLKYEIKFDCNLKSDLFLLDLGSVFEIASVKLNNVDIGVKICPPYVFEVDKEIIKSTSNELVVEITNTLAKSNSHDLDKYMAQEPSGLLGPVKLLIKK